MTTITGMITSLPESDRVRLIESVQAGCQLVLPLALRQRGSRIGSREFPLLRGVHPYAKDAHRCVKQTC